jgi:hypothetical protein
MLDAGVTAAEIAHRVRSGALIREHRGVYRVGHRAPCIEATYMAAVRAAGPGALLAGEAAAYLYELLDGPAPPAEIVTRANRRVLGVAVHRCRRLDHAREAAVWRGLPVTTVPRTIVDIAANHGDDELARVVHVGGVLHATRPAHIEAALARRPTTPAAGRLRRILRGDTHLSLSVLESRFLKLLRFSRLPLPLTNRRTGGRFVDCRWPGHKLTVELDSYRFHSSRYAWEQDRRREREAYARGDDFRRYTYGDVCEHTASMLRELRTLLPTVPPSGRSTTKRRDGGGK